MNSEHEGSYIIAAHGSVHDTRGIGAVMPGSYATAEEAEEAARGYVPGLLGGSQLEIRQRTNEPADAPSRFIKRLTGPEWQPS